MGMQESAWVNAEEELSVLILKRPVYSWLSLISAVELNDTYPKL